VGVISASLWIAVQFGVGALHRGSPGSIWERLMSAHGRRTSSWASTEGSGGVKTGTSGLPKARALLAGCAVIATVLMLDGTFSRLPAPNLCWAFLVTRITIPRDSSMERACDTCCPGFRAAWIEH
jgi:hypothetical protein